MVGMPAMMHMALYSPNIHLRVSLLIFQLKTSPSLITRSGESHQNLVTRLIACFHLIKISLITSFNYDRHCWPKSRENFNVFLALNVWLASSILNTFE